MQKKLALALALFLALTMLAAGCGTAQPSTQPTIAPTVVATPAQTAAPELKQVELSVLAPGDVPRHWDEVLAAVNQQTTDKVKATLNVTFIPWSDYSDKSRVKLVSGDTFDSMYDAPWMHMGQLIAQNAYLAIDDLLNQYGPNVKKAIGDTILKSNMMNGKLYGLPLLPYLYREPGGVLYYRKDLVDKYKLTDPKTLDDFEAYLKAVTTNEKGMIGFVQDPTVSVQKCMVQPANERILLLDGVGSRILNAFYNLDTKKVEIRSVFENPAFVSTQKVFYKWYTEGLIDQDTMTRKDDIYSMFTSGKAAMVLTDKFAMDGVQASLTTSVPGGVVGVQSLYPDGYKFMQDFASWNFQCVNAKAANPERLMMFFDWTYSSQDNYDLLKLGVKDKTWKDAGNNTWDYSDGVDASTGYNLGNGLLVEAMSMDKNWAQDSDATKAEWKRIRDFNAFLVSPLAGFAFSSDPVKNELAQLEAIAPQTITLLNAGVVDIDAVKADYEQKWKDAGLDAVRAEFQKQVEGFLAAHPIQ